MHCVLIQAHAAVMGGAGPRLLGPGTWDTKGPEQTTQEGNSEQSQRSHGHRYLGGGEQEGEDENTITEALSRFDTAHSGELGEGAGLGRELASSSTRLQDGLGLSRSPSLKWAGGSMTFPEVPSECQAAQ